MAATRVLDESNDHDVATAEPQIEDATEKREAAAVPSTDRVNQILGPKRDPKGGSPIDVPQQGPGGQTPAHHGDELAFGSGEHQAYGDIGAKAAGHEKPYVPKHDPKTDADPLLKFELSHGDLVMLSGDYFDPREKNQRGESVPDNLFKLANTRSKNPGQEVGTQDEIMFAIKDATPEDPRFAKGGAWEHVKFSSAVIAAVQNRYLQLAAHNYEHFANPDGKGGGPKSGNRNSAGGSYRALHEDAIHRAHSAKSMNEPIDEAMAHEAAAEHFLTDAFSAGHIRTPRESIEVYWNGKYPLFFENLKKSIAKDVAIFINANEHNVATQLGSVRDFMEPILAQIDTATASLPAVGIDAIVATLTHDEDNAVGLDVRNDAGQKWHTFGDSHGGLDPSKLDQADTEDHVEQAVKLGVTDVQNAFNVAPTADDAATLKQVRAATPTPAKPNQPKYGPEQLIPYPDPDAAKANGKLGWKQPDFATLWKTEVRSGQKETYGSMIIDSMTKGDFGQQLAKLAPLFPPEQDVMHGITQVHPQRAYLEGFLQPLQDPAKTQKQLQQIIDYDPGRGVSSTDEDNATTADIERLQQQGTDAQQAGDRHANKNSRLAGLTITQRVAYVKNLESTQGQGTTVLEQDEILELFQTAPKAERKQLFQLLEHRAWSGSLQGWKAFGDDIWINFDHAHIVAFDKMMNS